MPTPNKGESEADFIPRCMGNKEANKSFPNQKQRAAFCYSTWAKHEGKATAAVLAFLESVADQMEKVHMSGSIHINAAGKAHLDSLVAAGKDSTSAWSAPPGGSDHSWYLAIDSSEAPTSEAHYKYPFTADGKTVNRKALASIESYATQNGQGDVASAAHEALQKLDAKNSMAETADTSGKLQNVEVFKVGKWRGSKTVDATPALLDQIVSNFQTINQVPGYGVPVKLGHSHQIGEPAYGWMSDIARVGDTLVADFQDMDPVIVDAIGKRRYNAVSVELYPRIQHAGKVFENVLGGVALLGAEWPAVKGLKPLSASMFAGATEKLELMKEPNVANDELKFSQAQNDALVTAAETRVRTEMQPKIDAEKTRADKAAADLVIAQTALKTFRDEADQKVIDAVITAAENAGKIVPANKDKVAKFAASVLKATDPAERAELLVTFTDLVNGLGQKVKFGEEGRSKTDTSTADGQKAADQIDAKAKELLASITSGKLSYEAAVQKVLATDPELKRAYAQEM